MPSASTSIQTYFFSDQISPTPANIKHVLEVEELISLFCHQTLDFSKLILLYKTLKAAKLVVADCIVLNCTNTELLTANTQKKQQAQRIGTQYDGQEARVLSSQDVEKKK